LNDMSKRTAAMLSAALFVAIGCGPAASSLPPSAAILSLLPVDLATGVVDSDESSPRVRISVEDGAPYGAAEQLGFVEGVTLRSLSDGRAVGGESRWWRDAGYEGLELRPSAPLERGWYEFALSAASLQRSYEIYGGGRSIQFAPGDRVPDELLTTHFFVGSLPILGVTLSSNADRPTLVLQSSEAMQLVPSDLDPLSLVTVTSGDVPVECALQRLEGFEGVATSLAANHRLVLDCEPFDFSTPLTVAVRPGIQSLTGVPLRDAAGRVDASVTWTPSESGPMAPRVFSAALVEAAAAR
jgi:hypothetical protein